MSRPVTFSSTIDFYSILMSKFVQIELQLNNVPNSISNRAKKKSFAILIIKCANRNHFLFACTCYQNRKRFNVCKIEYSQYWPTAKRIYVRCMRESNTTSSQRLYPSCTRFSWFSSFTHTHTHIRVCIHVWNKAGSHIHHIHLGIARHG